MAIGYTHGFITIYSTITYKLIYTNKESANTKLAIVKLLFLKQNDLLYSIENGEFWQISLQKNFFG